MTIRLWYNGKLTVKYDVLDLVCHLPGTAQQLGLKGKHRRIVLLELMANGYITRFPMPFLNKNDKLVRSLFYYPTKKGIYKFRELQKRWQEEVKPKFLNLRK